MENAITYSDVLVLNRNPVDLRIKMVQTAQQYGVSYAARAFNTTRKSIRNFSYMATIGVRDRCAVVS